MNRRYRETTHPTDDQIFKIAAAAIAAFNAGYPLNLFITIQFYVAGLGPFEAQDARQRYLKHVGDWLRKVAHVPSCYVYVFENNPGGGLHVHILLHVPKTKLKQFHGRRQSWAKASGIPNKSCVFRSEPVGGSNDPSSKEYWRQLSWLVGYFSKGRAPGGPTDFGPKPRDQGIVIGKRAGYSQFLGRAIPRKVPSSERKEFVRAFLSRTIPTEAPLYEAKRTPSASTVSVVGVE